MNETVGWFTALLFALCFFYPRGSIVQTRKKRLSGQKASTMGMERRDGMQKTLFGI
jgi:hypothetical protein